MSICTPEFVHRRSVPSSNILFSVWCSVAHPHHTGKTMPVRWNLHSARTSSTKAPWEITRLREKFHIRFSHSSPNNVFNEVFLAWTLIQGMPFLLATHVRAAPIAYPTICPGSRSQRHAGPRNYIVISRPNTLSGTLLDLALTYLFLHRQLEPATPVCTAEIGQGVWFGQPQDVISERAERPEDAQIHSYFGLEGHQATLQPNCFSLLHMASFLLGYKPYLPSRAIIWRCQ